MTYHIELTEDQVNQLLSSLVSYKRLRRQANYTTPEELVKDVAKIESLQIAIKRQLLNQLQEENNK